MTPIPKHADTIGKFERYIITLTVMLVAVIEVLDMTIVNVSLPNMMGSLGANSDQITWVLTSYIVAAAVCMPLTGLLVKRIGQKRLLSINIIGFLVSSILCGLSTSLAQMVFFRTMQGVFGASLVPLSQLILRQTYPRSEQGKAMAIWGIGIMSGPVMGPTLGGYITEILNWRWVFYINIPICIAAFFLSMKFIQETPKQKQKIDWLGMILMASGIGSLQIFLDRGNSEDWFEASSIIVLFILCVVCLSGFIVRGWRRSDNIINLQLFKDKNFALSELLITLYTINVLGIITIQPLMLENIMGYSSKFAGIIMAPRGIASALAMAVVAQLMGRYKAKYLLLAGLAFSFIGTYLMTQFKINTPINLLMWAGAVQGFGMGLFFVPLSTLAFSTLQTTETAEASGLFSFGRSLGSSIGISILITVVTRTSQIHWNQLGGYINPFNHHLIQWLQSHHWQLKQPMALASLTEQLSKQASMNAFIDCYALVCLSLLSLLPFILMIEDNKKIPASTRKTSPPDKQACH